MKALIAALLTGTFLISGCVSTPESRVEENRDLFESFSASQKEIILKGEVDLDFTHEMVMLAAGLPDRKAKKRSKESSSEVWTYYKYQARSIFGYGGYGGGYHSYYSYNSHYGGWFRNSYWPNDIIVANYGESEKNLVVEFQEGKVISFEMVQ